MSVQIFCMAAMFLILAYAFLVVVPAAAGEPIAKRIVELTILLMFPVAVFWHWWRGDLSLRKTIPHTFNSWRTTVWKRT